METLKRVFSLRRNESTRGNKSKGTLRYKAPPMPKAASTDSMTVQFANHAPIRSHTSITKSSGSSGSQIKPTQPPAPPRPVSMTASPLKHDIGKRPSAVYGSSAPRQSTSNTSADASSPSRSFQPARPLQSSSLRLELRPAPPPRPMAGPRLSEDAVRKKMDSIAESIDRADLELGRTFRDLRRLGLMDNGGPGRPQDMLQINYEKKLRATLENMVALAKEKDAMIETIGKGGALEEQLIAYVELLWRQKISKMTHFSDMGNYETSAIDPKLVEYTAEVLERTRTE